MLQPEPTPAPDAAPAAPAAPVADSAPAQPTEPAPAPAQTEQKRLQDTQTAFHKKAEEASELRRRLNAIYNHPEIGLLVRAAMETPETQPAVDPLAQAVQAYKAAPNDDEAIKHLLVTAQSLAVTEMEKREKQRAAQTATAQRNHLIVAAVSEAVAKVAPDVPLRLFWSYTQQAQLETPPALTNQDERIEWQMHRAIELSRGDLQPLLSQAGKTATQATQIQQAAAAVMPGGTTARPATGAPATTVAPMSLVDQVRSIQQGRRLTA